MTKKILSALLIVSVLACFNPIPKLAYASGGIAFDAASTGSASASASITYSHTTSAGVDRILFVSGWCGIFTGVTLSATYNGVAMTSIAQVTGVNGTLAFFYLINPSSGANNVVISSTGTCISWRGRSSSYTGAAQTGQPNAFTTDSDTPAIVPTVANTWAISTAGGEGSNVSGNGTGVVRAGDGSLTLIQDSNGIITKNVSYGGLTTTNPGTVDSIIASFASDIVSATFVPWQFNDF